jgi:putative membrane protein
VMNFHRRGVHVANQSAGGAVAPLDATQLAVERTRLAHERTLMAWVRTATSLISFGFTIYKFFQFLRQEGDIGNPEGLFSSREFALLMIFVGLGMLVLATLQHWRNTKSLRAHSAEAFPSLALVLAILVAGLGLLGLLMVIFRQ